MRSSCCADANPGLTIPHAFEIGDRSTVHRVPVLGTNGEMDAVTTTSLFDVDPDLAEGLTPEALAVARRHLVARTFTLETGAWEPEGHDGMPDQPAIACYIVDGLITREVH